MTEIRRQEIRAKLGNVKMLVIERMSQMMVERNKKHAGGGFGIAAGIAADMAGGSIGRDAREAQQWVENAIRAVREAPGGEAYGDDEAIAGEILRQIEQRRAKSA